MPKEFKVNFIIENLTELVYDLLPGGSKLHQLINFNQSLKKARTDAFMKLLQEDIERFVGSGGKIEENKILNEHFVDCLETIWKKVTSTRSEEKIKYYRNILFRQMIEPDQYNGFLKLLSYCDRLNDVQIILLGKIANLYEKIISDIYREEPYNRFLGFGDAVEYEVNEFQKIEFEITGMNDYSVDIIPFYKALNIEKSEFEFYLLELKTFGLIKNILEGYKLKTVYIPTATGMKLLDFIKEYGNDE